MIFFIKNKSSVRENKNSIFAKTLSLLLILFNFFRNIYDARILGIIIPACFLI